MQPRSTSQSNMASVFRNRKLLASIVAVPLVSGLMQSQSLAADAWWDTNGATTGAATGGVAPGTWGVDPFWTTTSNGTGTPGAWIANDIAFFSAGTDASGAFTVTVSGTQIANGLTFQEGTVTLSGGQIDLGVAGAAIEVVGATRSAFIDSIIGGTVGLTKNGTGTLTLGAPTGYTGTTTVNAGTLHTNSTAALAGYSTAGSVVANTGGTVSVAVGGVGQWTTADVDTLLTNGTFNTGSSLGLQIDSGTITYSTDITAPIGLAKSGAGTLIIGGNNTAAVGTHAVNAGVLQIAAADRIADTAAVTVATGATFDMAGFNETVGSIGGAGDITMGAGNLSVGGNPATATLSGILSGSGNLTKTGTGVQVLSGANTYTGTTTVDGGTLRAATPGSLPGWNTPGQVTVNSATFGVSAGGTGQFTATEIDTILGGSVALNGTSSLNIQVDSANTFTYASNIANPIGLTKTGGGTLTLTGTNTYSGGTRAEAGTLRPASTAALPGYNTPGAVVATAGTVSVHAGGAGQWTAADLDALLANGTFNAGSAIGFNVDPANSFTYDTVIGGVLGVTKSGTGSASMGGANTYSGVTRVTGGALTITHNTALGVGAVAASNTIVSSGAALEIPSGLLVDEHITIAGSGISSGGAIRKTGTGDSTYSGTLSGSGTAARINSDGGTLTLTKGPFFLSSGMNVTFGGAGNITTTSATDPGSLGNFNIAISGSNRVIKDGTGTLTLGGINSFNGGVTINNGTVSFSADATGTGSQQLGAVPNYAANRIILDGGTLQYTNTATLFGNSNRGMQIGANGGTIRVANSVSSLFPSTIRAVPGVTNAVLTKTGPGEFRYNANATQTRAGTDFTKLVVNGGLFRLGFVSGADNTEIGFGAVPAAPLADAITLDGGAIGTSFGVTLNANRGITLGANGGVLNLTASSIVIPSVISGAGPLRVITLSTSLATLSGANTYTGKTIIGSDITMVGSIDPADPGRLSINADAALGAVPLAPEPDNVRLGTATAAGTLFVTEDATLSSNRGITIGAGNGTLSIATGKTVTYDGVMSGAGNLTKTDAGTLVLGGINTYTGTTTSFAGGVLAISADANLGTAPASPLANSINLGGATTGGTLRALASTTLNANRGINLNPGGADPLTGLGGTIDVVAAAMLTVPGVVSGVGKFTKAGDGTLVLTGTNTYSNTTTVNAGTLSVTPAAIPANNAVTVAGGTYEMSGGALFNPGSLTINAAGQATVAAGGDKTLKVNTLTVDGILAMNDNDFIVDYTGASPEFTLRDKVKAFADNPAATSGIDFTHGAGDVAIAVAEKTEWGQSVFNGVTLADDTVIIGKYTYYGDANLDGAVTSDDYVAVDVGLGTGDSWVQGDFNFSGSVTSDDYVAIDVNLGKGTPTPLAWAELKAEMVALHTAMFGAEYVEKLAYAEANGFGATLVPEPGAISVLGIGLVGMLARRRRR